jgi:hypothetical protein
MSEGCGLSNGIGMRVRVEERQQVCGGAPLPSLTSRLSTSPGFRSAAAL